ncbi:hypothetical protein [Pseudacidovorax intermedius]|uniref:hypothetical protein n=1 Tax=Pseudacidovorax intermedius TaxID=433924 RepID=UPI0009E8646A|nr:hypothetical protein [Pseudacidovorax intermedius]
MGWLQRLTETFGALAAAQPAPEPAPAPAPPAAPVREAAAAQDTADEPGFTRLTGNGTGRGTERDLAPLAQDRMVKLAEYLWQSNLLANRLIELTLAYLLAEGVTLQCKDDEHQKRLDRFWNDPINNWPLKLEPRVRELFLAGEQCYICHVNEANGMVRLGYLDPRQIGTVVMDPDNIEQPIGVVTRRDARGRYNKYRVVVLGKDEELFSRRTAEIRASDFTDGDCFLFQINKLPSGTRGRSDLLGQMDWLDAYDNFLFDEIDRIGFLRSFAWDVTMTGADDAAVKEFEKKFKAPSPNSTFVHNDQIKLEAKSPSLQAADTSTSARLLRNHVLGGATVPEHWFGGGGDVNRAAASEMGEPTFKVLTSRQTKLKLMLEEIGRFVLMHADRSGGEPDWSDERWQVTAVFPELINADLTKFAAAMQGVVSAVVILIDKGLMTQETGLSMVADVAQRFGQEFDAKAELEAAQEEFRERETARAAADTFNLPADLRAEQQRQQAGAGGAGAPTPAPAPAA